jgi:tetratricopeptide (TPR) repeat protein
VAFWAAVLVLCLATAGCGKHEPPAIERLAILPFQSLTSEGETDLVGPALLIPALASVPNLDPVEADSVPQAYARHANRFLHTYIVERAGKLQVLAEIEDAGSHKMLRHLKVAGQASSGMGPAVASLAKTINGAAKALNSPPKAAYEHLNDALRATNPATQDAAFQAAIEEDGQFAAAYVIWAKARLSRGDREGTAGIVEKGEAAGLDEYSAASLAYLGARAKQDNAAEIVALKRLTAVAPSDSEGFQHLAELEFAGRQFGESAAAYREALRLDPGDGLLENMRGYAEVLAGNPDQARQALKRYSDEVPEQRGNALDSLGEVDFYAGDFAGAEAAFLAAQAKNPGSGEWLKAAQARLMTGDLAGADQIVERFSSERKGEAAVYQRAQWQFLTGRRKSGLALIEEEAGRAKGDLAALMWAQTAIWKLQTGDRTGAGSAAQKAILEAATPGGRSLGGLARFLVDGGRGSGSAFADAVATIFQQDFPAALPLLEQAYRRTVPTTDGQIRMLLAWANVETGHFDRAKELLRAIPIPLASAEPALTSLIFPRFFLLRGAILEHEGKAGEARKDYQLFLRYSGDLPDIFRDGERARK